MALGRIVAHHGSQPLLAPLHGSSPAFSPLHGASQSLLGPLRGVSQSLGPLHRGASPASAPPSFPPHLTQNQLWILNKILDIRVDRSSHLLELERDTIRLSGLLADTESSYQDCIAECRWEYARIAFGVMTTVGGFGLMASYLLHPRSK